MTKSNASTLSKLRFAFKKSLILLVLMSFSCSQPSTANGIRSVTIFKELDKETVVYITKSGSKYHKEKCRYLRSSKLKMSLKDAVRNGYQACKVCKP